MEGAAVTLADTRECAVGDGGYWGQRRGMAGNASLAPQNPACEVPLWCSDYSDSAGCFAGVDFYDKIKFFYPLIYPKILCTFAH